MWSILGRAAESFFRSPTLILTNLQPIKPHRLWIDPNFFTNMLQANTTGNILNRLGISK